MPGIKNKFKVVVILVNYNSLCDTNDCIKSLSESIIKPFIVVVDNASVNSVELPDKLIKYEFGLQLLQTTENIGFGRANNVGIKWVQENIDFEYLLLLNNDTVIEKDALGYLIEAFDKDSQIGITTGKTMYQYDRGLVWYGGGNIDSIKGWPRITDFNAQASPTGANLSRFVNFVSGCVMMFSKYSIERLDGFDNDFFMYSEDLELSLRAQDEGFKLFYEAKAVIYHKVNGSSTGNSAKGFNRNNKNLPFIFFNMQKNRWLAMRKHRSGIIFFIFNIFFCTELLYRSLIFLKWKRFDMVKITGEIFSNTILAMK